MNIVYLIGNGFDVAQGLRTQYPEFYESYKHSAPVNEVEEKIIASINEQVALWSDLERTLGRFTKGIDDAEMFTEAYTSLSNKLKMYMRGQEGLFEPRNVRQFQNDLANPFSDLTYWENHSFYEFVSSFGNAAKVNVISFNYTDVLERAIGYQYRELPLEGPFFHKGIQLGSVIKVHGTLQGTILMGVNDASQIANEAFSKNLDVCDFLVKPQANETIGQGFDSVASELISSADLIVVFGMSIGETDRIWWNKVGRRMISQKVRMIIFCHREKLVPEDQAWRVGKVRREVKARFENVAGVPEKMREEMDSRIFVSFRGFMFNPNVVRYDPREQTIR